MNQLERIGNVFVIEIAGFPWECNRLNTTNSGRRNNVVAQPGSKLFHVYVYEPKVSCPISNA